MNDAPQQALTGQQLQAMEIRYAEKITAIKRDIELRKWAVDQACGLAGAAYEGEASTVDVVGMSRAIHAFLTEGAGEKAE